MATAMASKPQAPFGKMKRPAAPHVQTNINGVKTGNPSPSPSSATKRLPGQSQPSNSAVNQSALTNGIARPTRRPQRNATRTNTNDNAGMERRNVVKDPEPYVPNEPYILKKFCGQPPSLIVHLHTTHFRFDQQDGNFPYSSEMRIFIEHLQKKTIPHDMLEEFRKSGVKFYNGWLIVRVVDHKSIARNTANTNAVTEDEKPFSVHNYNPYITPSAFAPYPAKEQPPSKKSPMMKQENGVGSSSQHMNGDSSSTVNGDLRSDDAAHSSGKSGKAQPRVFHVALRPTDMSKHVDLGLDSMMLDPKSAVNRKQSQAFGNIRTPASANMGAPPTPISNLPTTPGIERGPQPKKRKLWIDPKELRVYEARCINLTAPPLILDPADSLEEAQNIMMQLEDPMYDNEPPSPKSRKRTVAELAADDAHAKEQERFMLIMAQRGDPSGANTSGDGQAAVALFQPDFSRFSTIQNLQFQAAERKQREDELKTQEDAEKRNRDEERKRNEHALRMQHEQQQQQQRIQAENLRRQQQAEQRKAQMQQVQMQQQANQQAMNQTNSVPPSMQNQILQNQLNQRSSPVIHQSTPHGNSSPNINSVQSHGVTMAATGSGQGVGGSPPRPGSAVQHGHPGAAMARGPSNQGPSRNGTPQIPHGTPAMRQGTPVMRQGTPNQRMSQASPHAGMMAPTPQMTHVGMMGPGQIPNGMGAQPNSAAHMAQIQMANRMQQQQAAMGQQSIQQPNQAAIAHFQAQQRANHEVMLQQRQRQAQQQQLQQQMGTPQQVPPSPANSAQSAQNQYSQNLRQQLQSQMQNVQHGSPQPTPQQQMAQMAQQGQQQHRQPMTPQQMAAMQAAVTSGQQMPNGVPHSQQGQQQMRAASGQQGVPIPIQIQQQMQNLRTQQQRKYTMEAAQKYGGNPAAIQLPEQQEIMKRATNDAQAWLRNWEVKRRQTMAQQRQAQQMQLQAQAQGGGQGMTAQQMQMMQAHHNQQQQQMAMHQQQQAQAHAQAQAQAQFAQMNPQQQAQFQQRLMQQQAAQGSIGGQVHGMPGPK